VFLSSTKAFDANVAKLPYIYTKLQLGLVFWQFTLHGGVCGRQTTSYVNAAIYGCRSVRKTFITLCQLSSNGFNQCIVLCCFSNDKVAVAEDQYWAEYLKMFVRPGLYSAEPLSDILYPVSTNLDTLRTFESNHSDSSYDAVATVATTIYWREFIRGKSC
jgi:hypothetical protein